MRILALFCLLAATLVARESFWDSLTPAQRELAGIAQLNEQQRAALNALASQFVTAQSVHEVTAASQRARAEAMAQADAEQKSRLGFSRAPSAKDVIRSRIVGEFRGWQAGTVFQLENGQTWIVEGREARAFSLRRDPEVEIQPAAFGAWKLYVQPEGLWVHVKRVK